MRPSGNARVLEARRKKAIKLLNQGFPPVKVASLLGVDRRSVRRWKAAYRKEGMKALQARPTSGRPCRLTSERKKELRILLKKRPVSVGFKGEKWTYILISKAIEKKYGVVYHRNYIGPLLRSLGIEKIRF